MAPRVTETNPAPPPPTYRSLADGRYLLVRKLAEGGTAIVYLGYDTKAEEWRAIKTLLPEYTKRPALRNRFEREAQMMKELKHPNIIPVYEAGTDGDTAYMVMEFAEAGSVIDWVERHGAMPPRMAVELGIALCAGIQFAHEEGVIHRDIKPQNLLIDRHGVAKVTDFGIAQAVEATRMTMTGTVMGTIGYMSPEQHESAKHADERADVYSIAATLYTLLRGEAATHLFMADDGDFEGIPTPVADVVRKASQYRRDARYATVAEMARDLRAALDRLPPDPLDVPPLVPPDLPILDDTTPPDFSAVRPVGPDTFGGSLDPSPRLTPPSRPDLQDEREDTVPTGPSVLPRQVLTSPGLRREVRPTDREAQERARRLRNGVIGVGVVGGLLFLLVLGFGLSAGSQLTRMHAYEDRMAAELYRQYDHEIVLVDALQPLGLRGWAEIRDLFEQVRKERDPEARYAAAVRLYRALDLALRELDARRLPSEEHVRLQLRESLKQLGDRQRAHDQVVAEIEAYRTSVPGRIAGAIGF